MRALWDDVASNRREIRLAAFLGFLASASAVALLGTSGWLISRAAELPPVLTLTVAAALVRTFAISRGLMRYLERLVGHDAAFRGLTVLRVRVYQSLELITPLGLASSRAEIYWRALALMSMRRWTYHCAWSCRGCRLDWSPWLHRRSSCGYSPSRES